ncbi:MAG: hypothetical protein LBS36_02090 [Oscillospiraceae bacterium]|jgi:hypothetical protein|nr:hypothetical protein [Oscillospiraceae bacterium]
MKIRLPKIFQIQLAVLCVLLLALMVFIAATEFRSSMARARAAWNIFLILSLFAFCVLSLVFNYIKIRPDSIKLYYLSLDFGVVIDKKKIRGIRKVKSSYDFFMLPFWGLHTYELLTTTQKFLIHVENPKEVAEMLGVAYLEQKP